MSNNLQQTNFIPVGKKHTDAHVLFVGHEICEPSHAFGPHIRDHHLVHYIKEGCGTLYDKYGEHTATKGDIFIIRRGEATTYVADSKTPWEYVWLAFDGCEDEDFLTLPSVLPYPATTFLTIEEGIRKGYSYCFFASRLHSFFHHLFEEERAHPSPEILLYEHIELQYMHPFSMESLSHRFGFDRSYLGRLFKRRYGKSPKEHLLEVRLAHAKKFLSLGYSVGESGAMCGYADPFAFSKIFKAHIGVTPSEHRKKVAK